MRAKEHYTVWVSTALGLTLAIFASFQVYLMQESSRITDVTAQDNNESRLEGQLIFGQYCKMCHGNQGEGKKGSPLNDKTFLSSASNSIIFSVISSGVPGTEMPAWNQLNGGPLTDQQVHQLVGYIRSWEANAIDRRALALQGDPVNGLIIYTGVCVVCHGGNGAGTDKVPALNDPARLARFDDSWYVAAITNGNPDKGMPIWGRVLSRTQVADLVALLRAWQRKESVSLPDPKEFLQEAESALGNGDVIVAQDNLEAAAGVVSGDMLVTINAALTALKSGDRETALVEIKKAEAMSNP